MASAPPPKTSYIAAIIVINSAAAIGYTLSCKTVLKVIPLSLTVLWIQATVSCLVLMAMSRLYPASGIMILRPWKVWRTFMPLALTRILGALSKTACLANVDAAFYQTARGLLLPFTVLLSLYFLPQTRFAPLTLVGIGLVILGFAGGIIVDLQQSLSLNWGIALGVWSSFTTAVETVVLKHFTAGNDMHMLQLIYMSSAVAALVYGPLVYIFEADAWNAAPLEKHHQFLMNSMVSSAVALVLSFATWMQVKVTSPVTHTVVAATRGVLQSLLASISFNESLPFHRWISTIFILGGTAVYTYSKSTEKAAGGAAYAPVAGSEAEARTDENELKEVRVQPGEKL